MKERDQVKRTGSSSRTKRKPYYLIKNSSLQGWKKQKFENHTDQMKYPLQIWKQYHLMGTTCYSFYSNTLEHSYYWNKCRSSWGVINVRTEPQGSKARPITDATSTALGTEEMAVGL
jgi:hypothetical protein